jgi:hypothetical protein
MPLRVRVWARHAPKRGNSADEYEDAFWPPRGGERRGRVLRCAVADGATEASFSARWAQMLTRAYCRGALDVCRLAETLRPLQAAWSAEIGGRPLPWYAQEKVRQGAFSSLLGLTIRDGRWEAIAVGDSCLFLVRDDELITAFPLQASDLFGSTPLLLSSNPARNAALGDHLCQARGEALPGDRFLLMTDAVACWFLADAEAGGQPWNTIPPGRRFASWLAGRRAAHVMRNDDVTVLGLDLLTV